MRLRLKMYRFWMWFVCLTTSIPIFAAGHPLLDSIRDLPGDLQAHAIDDWFYKLDKRDTNAVFAALTHLDESLHGGRMQRIREQLYVTRWYYRAFGIPHDQSQISAMFHTAMEEIAGRGWYMVDGLIHVFYGFYLKENGRWGPAFENMLKGYRILREHDYLERTEAVKAIYLIGLAYYHFGEGREALPFFLPSVHHRYAKEIGVYHYNTINTIALCYQRAEVHDSAAYYYALALALAREAGADYFAALIQGNYGQMLFEQGKLDEALPLMLHDFEESRKNQEIGATMNAGLTLADIYLAKGQPERVAAYLDVVRQHIRPQEYEGRARYFRSCFRYFNQIGDPRKAALYADSAMVARDSAQARKDVASLSQARLKVEVERHNREIRELESARNRQVILRNGILIISALSSIIMFQFFYRKAYKRRKELQLAELNEHVARQELDSAQKELESFTRSLREKNELIDVIRSELETLRELGVQQMDERTERLQYLLQSTILTDDDWTGFRNMFEKVHPGFFVRLRESMPDLTPADTRLLALTKLKLTSKEMSGILGISADSIKKSRQRLRRRLHLPEEGSLDELIEGI